MRTAESWAQLQRFSVWGGPSSLPSVPWVILSNCTWRALDQMMSVREGALCMSAVLMLHREHCAGVTGTSDLVSQL